MPAALRLTEGLGRTRVPEYGDRHTKCLVAWHLALLLTDNLESRLAVDSNCSSIPAQNLCAHSSLRHCKSVLNQSSADSLTVSGWVNVQPRKLIGSERDKSNATSTDFSNVNYIVVEAFILSCLIECQVSVFQTSSSQFITSSRIVDLADTIPIFGGVGADFHCAA